MHWWRLALVASLVILLAVGGLWWLRAHAPHGSAGCGPLKDDLSLPPASLLETPVFVGAEAAVELSFDGVAAGQQKAVDLAPGRHALRVQAPGLAPLGFDFRLDAFHPALFEARALGKHLSLVFLGAECVSCPKGNGPELLPEEAAGAPYQALEERAAVALERGDWPTAAAALRQVQPGERRSEAFQRLAQPVLQASGAHAEARGAAAALSGLSELLKTWDDSVKSEAQREHDYFTRRWNALTEVYSRLLGLNAELPDAFARADAQLPGLSAAYRKANEEKSAAGERESVERAEAVVRDLVRALRQARPYDCELQAKVTAAL